MSNQSEPSDEPTDGDSKLADVLVRVCLAFVGAMILFDLAAALVLPTHRYLGWLGFIGGIVGQVWLALGGMFVGALLNRMFSGRLGPIALMIVFLTFVTPAFVGTVAAFLNVALDPDSAGRTVDVQFVEQRQASKGPPTIVVSTWKEYPDNTINLDWDFVYGEPRLGAGIRLTVHRGWLGSEWISSAVAFAREPASWR